MSIITCWYKTIAGRLYNSHLNVILALTLQYRTAAALLSHHRLGGADTRDKGMITATLYSSNEMLVNI